jgi:DNA-binding XRE family transcriptional regulator
VTKHFGKKIAEVRKHYKLSQEEFGKSLGIGKSAVSQAERDAICFKESVVKHIISVYSLNPNWFYHDQGDMILPAQTLESAFLADCTPEVVSLLALTKKILKSGNSGAYDALKANILHFYEMIEIKDRNSALEKRVTILEETVKKIYLDPDPEISSSEETGT